MRHALQLCMTCKVNVSLCSVVYNAACLIPSKVIIVIGTRCPRAIRSAALAVPMPSMCAGRPLPCLSGPGLANELLVLEACCRANNAERVASLSPHSATRYHRIIAEVAASCVVVLRHSLAGSCTAMHPERSPLGSESVSSPSVHNGARGGRAIVDGAAALARSVTKTGSAAVACPIAAAVAITAIVPHRSRRQKIWRIASRPPRDSSAETMPTSARTLDRRARRWRLPQNPRSIAPAPPAWNGF